MRLADFEAMVRRMAAEVPADFLDGVAEIVVSPRTVPHSEREEIWTLGECVPLPGDDGNPRHLQSRVVLYYGSFAALARDAPGFDWRAEAWETLTHEIRHHVEWRARAPDLEALDRAAEANFARLDGEPFDPQFYRDGESFPDGLFRVEDDWFLERHLTATPGEVGFRWRGEDYRTSVPPEVTLPAFLSVTGLADPPPGELVLVFQRRAGLRDLFRAGPVYQGEVEARLDATPRSPHDA